MSTVDALRHAVAAAARTIGAPGGFAAWAFLP